MGLVASSRTIQNSWTLSTSVQDRLFYFVRGLEIHFFAYVQTSQETVDSLITWSFTISSARTTLISQPPPMRNEIVGPIILKRGEVRVPWGPSPWISPAFASSEGRFSCPPIHQSPCWWAGCPLLRAVGLSPKVGWLSNAVPFLSQPSIPFSKSKLQSVCKQTQAKV